MSSNKVAILLASFNGSQYLEEQISSILQQTHKNWTLYASDDCSEDNTYDLLQKFSTKYPKKINLFRHSSRQGCTKNFLSLVFNRSIDANFFAFCDQDDYWNPDKLERGIKVLSQIKSNELGLYGTRTAIIDKSKSHILGFSPIFKDRPNFLNALVQCIMGGNTTLFNNRARKIFLQSDKKAAEKLISHEWALYALVSGCGGYVHYDTYPSVQYRQHNKNRTGSNIKLSAQLIRINKLLKGEFRDWNDRNIKFLKSCHVHFTKQNIAILNEFIEARKSPIFRRLIKVKKTGIYRQGFFNNTAFWAATILGKV